MSRVDHDKLELARRFSEAASRRFGAQWSDRGFLASDLRAIYDRIRPNWRAGGRAPNARSIAIDACFDALEYVEASRHPTDEANRRVVALEAAASSEPGRVRLENVLYNIAGVAGENEGEGLLAGLVPGQFSPLHAAWLVAIQLVDAATNGDDVVRVSFVGAADSGKSTLINHLLGLGLSLPVADGDTTGAPVAIRFRQTAAVATARIVAARARSVEARLRRYQHLDDLDGPSVARRRVDAMTIQHGGIAGALTYLTENRFQDVSVEAAIKLSRLPAAAADLTDEDLTPYIDRVEIDLPMDSAPEDLRAAMVGDDIERYEFIDTPGFSSNSQNALHAACVLLQSHIVVHLLNAYLAPHEVGGVRPIASAVSSVRALTGHASRIVNITRLDNGRRVAPQHIAGVLEQLRGAPEDAIVSATCLPPGAGDLEEIRRDWEARSWADDPERNAAELSRQLLSDRGVFKDGGIGRLLQDIRACADRRPMPDSRRIERVREFVAGLLGRVVASRFIGWTPGLDNAQRKLVVDHHIGQAEKGDEALKRVAGEASAVLKKWVSSSGTRPVRYDNARALVLQFIDKANEDEGVPGSFVWTSCAYELVRWICDMVDRDQHGARQWRADDARTAVVRAIHLAERNDVLGTIKESLDRAVLLDELELADSVLSSLLPTEQG